jgi:hypothetical protein
MAEQGGRLYLVLQVLLEKFWQGLLQFLSQFYSVLEILLLEYSASFSSLFF